MRGSAQEKRQAYHKRKYWYWFVGLSVIIIELMILTGVLLIRNLDKMEARGAFGDMFGVATALFSGLAFVGLIIALVMQKEELSLQRDELKKTTAALERQGEGLRQQNETLKKEAFEATFFRLLENFIQIRDGIDVAGKRKEECGVDAFKVLYELLRKDSDNVASMYDMFYNEFHHDLGHYFRLLYRLMLIVDKGEVKDKEFYAKIVRAQLSSYELALLYFNCNSPVGEGFAEMVATYNLLKHLNARKLKKDFGTIISKSKDLKIVLPPA